MEPELRPARPEDKAAIGAFTQGTFAWGDYVEDAFDDWLADPHGCTLVAEVGGRPIAVARGALLSPTEAWSQGLRVHPDHRRHHLGTTLLEHLASWATAAGARVMRLATDADNQPALNLFAAMGFHPVGAWLTADRPLEEGPPRPGGNGGRRVPAAERLTPAPAFEADAAMLAWSGSPLEQAAHGLFATHWCWRRLTLSDLESAGHRRALWQARSGWALADQEEETLRVSWLHTDSDQARTVLRSLADLAAGAGAERLQIQVPDVDWLRAALERAGWQLHHQRVCARAL